MSLLALAKVPVSMVMFKARLTQKPYIYGPGLATSRIYMFHSINL